MPFRTRATTVLACIAAVSSMVGAPSLRAAVRPALPGAPADRWTSGPERPAVRVDVRGATRQVTPSSLEARARLAEELGAQGIVQIDPSLGTVRSVLRLDGTLTPPSTDGPRAIALGFVRSHLDALGLTRADLDTLVFRRDYVDVLGTHHLSWTQRVGGLDTFQAGLEAAVTADGRLAALHGPIARGLAEVTTRFALERDDAFAAARAAADAPARMPSTAVDHAERVLFPTSNGARPAWKVRAVTGPARIDRTIIDGRTGRVLWSANSVVHDQVGSGLAWPAYPSDTIPNGGGTQTPVTFPVLDGTALSGNNAHVFTDVRGEWSWDPRPTDEVPAVEPATLSWASPAVLENNRPRQNCTPDWNCTWDSKEPLSWRTNRVESATNTYWLMNHYHDYLEAAPIGFTEEAGNFQLVNDDGAGGLDGDPMLVAGMLGAKGRNGLPDYVNNAFIGPAPDGESPVVGLLLFRRENYGRRAPFGPGIPSTDAGVDAMVVYHEYTHGLSHRLVTFPDGEAALNSLESASMGEAWSDWYALDLLEADGFLVDSPAVDMPVGMHVTGGDGIRFQFADCLVDSPADDCPEPVPADPRVGPGGYTYGDLSHIAGFPEVHSDGEIWLQTLWELRDAIGRVPTVRLVTRAMELSPADPSFLDMRNAILLADTIVSGGADHDDIWQVFAGRGMGFFAESAGRWRPEVQEDFALPVSCPGVGCGRVEGVVIDAGSGAPVVGATVTIDGSFTGIPVELSAVTGADGSYTIDDVPNHEYRRVVADAPGFLRERATDVRVAGTADLDLELTRNWAQLDGGAVITRQVGPGLPGEACGADLSLDGDLATGWTTRRIGGQRPSITIQLPQPVDIDRIVIGRSPCASRRFMSLEDFSVFTRRDRAPWVKALVNRAPLGKHRSVVSFPLDRGDSDVSQVRLVLAGAARPGPHVSLAEFRVRGLGAA